MAGYLEKVPKIYPISQCAIYKLRNKRKLAEILESSLQSLVGLSAAVDNYRTWTDHSGGKARVIEEPKHALKRVHIRLANLLRRVERPQYLFSGGRGCSPLKNALAHQSAHPTVTLDIKSFYGSVSEARIYRIFSYWLKCSPDVSTLLTRLCAKDGHVPTGSPISQELGFWAYRDLFNEIDEYVRGKRGVFSLYVDDVTATFPGANWSSVRRLGRMIERAGLQWGKAHVYGAGTPKKITGVIVRDGQTRLANRQHLKLVEDAIALEGETSIVERLRIARRMCGRYSNAQSIDQRLANRYRGARAALVGLERNLAIVDVR